MAIPDAVNTARADLRAAFATATPLETAPPLIFVTLRDKARDLVVAIDAAVVTTGSILDAPAIPGEVQAIPSLLTAVAAHNADESILCDLRSLAGRIRTNINLSVR